MKLGLGQPDVKHDTNILEITIPKEMEKAIPTGHGHIDRLYCGDGILAGTVSLVTGDPGAGKSTLMMTLADRLSGLGHRVLYFTGEEVLYQVRRVTKRLGFRHGFLAKYDMEAQGIIEEIEHHRKEMAKKKGKHLFVMVDSLQCLRLRKEKGVRGRPPSEEKQMLSALEMLTEYSKNNWIPLFIIGHVNKKGEFAGKQTIKHAVDCHLHISVDVDPDTGMEERFLVQKKNRFGPSGVYCEASLTDSGFSFKSDTASYEP